ncbi:MAG: aspartate dehydrogenase [Candidatus Hydrogenedentales bacterium]|jgi:aspartate dehydrogenase
MRVGLVGCGNIGTDVCLALQKGDIPAKIAALTDIDRSRAERCAQSVELSARICDVEENAASVDFLVECADVSAVAEVVEAAIRHGRDCLILSLGGLVAAPELFDAARQHGVKIWLPSGALAGLDGVRAGREGGLERVTLTTRKPPKGLAGAPYLVERGISLDGLDEPKVVFDGTAREAVKAFPKNVNVAANLSFAGIGPERTRVRVIADPQTSVNSHEIVAEGAFGRLVATTENQPSPRNAKSSYLASLSGCAELRAAAEAFVMRRSEGAGRLGL